jgi:hypothetical protein
MAMPMSAAGMALGLGSIPGITGTAGLGDALESDEERKRRLAQIAQQRSLLNSECQSGCELAVRLDDFNGVTAMMAPTGLEDQLGVTV